jgi:hypothetical protein
LELGSVGRFGSPASVSANTGPHYYFDTSAQLDRHCGEARIRRALKKLAMDSGGVATSTQVEREWNRIVLGALAALSRALRTAEDYTDVVRTLSKGYGRKPSQRWQVLNLITENKTADLDEVAARLQDYRRIRARAMWRTGLREVRDGTKCGVARRRLEYDGGRWAYHDTCRKIEEICDQPAFLEENRDRAEAAARALLDSDREGDRKMGKKALNALSDEDRRSTKGAACHGGGGIGGDICIALECEEHEVLVSTDASFDLICPALGLKRQNPNAL